MKRILTGVFCLSLIVCQGQQSRIDSISALLGKHSQTDTAMLTLLRWLAFYHQDTDANRGIEIADSASAIANRMGESGEHLAGLYNSKGVLYWAKGDNKTAISILSKASEIFTRLNLEERRAISYINTANAYINLGQFDSAFAYFNKVKDYYVRIGDSTKLVRIYNSLGVIYQYVSNLAKAMDYFNKAQIIFERMGDMESLAAVYTNIGIINNNLERYPKALEYYKRALAVYKKTGGKQSVAEALVNIGTAYYQLNDLTKSQEYFLSALEVCRQTGAANTEKSCLTNLAQIYADKNEYNKALSVSKEGLEIPGETGNQEVDAYNMLSKIILKAPDSVLGKNGISPSARYTTAIAYAKKSLNQATAIQNTIGEYYAWENLSNIYSAQKRYDKALEAYKKFSILKDSVFASKKIQEIAWSEAQFNFDKEKVTIAANNERKEQMTKQKELLKRGIIIGVGIILLMAAIFYALYEKKKNEARVAEAEIKMLLAQMNPHFIFNALNSINSYIMQNGSDTNMQSHYLIKFSRLMRMVLEASRQKEISLAKDLEILEIYLQMEMRRTGNKFSYEIITDPKFDIEKVMVPPMLLQPFAENSIWHGFTQKAGTGKLDIQIVKDGKMISFKIKDNGIGRKEAARIKNQYFAETMESRGLAITKQRIEMLNFQRQAHSSMDIHDLEQGTLVEIKIPLKEIPTAA